MSVVAFKQPIAKPEIADSELQVIIHDKKKKPYYILEGDDLEIDHILPEGIYHFLYGEPKCEQQNYTVAYFVPTQHGHKVKWRITGDQYMERCQLIIR